MFSLGNGKGEYRGMLGCAQLDGRSGRPYVSVAMRLDVARIHPEKARAKASDIRRGRPILYGRDYRVHIAPCGPAILMNAERDRRILPAIPFRGDDWLH